MKNNGKLYSAVVLIAAISLPAYGQEFTIKLTGPELDIVGKGLGTQSFNDAAPLLQKLREQVQAQQVKPAEPKVEEKKE